MRLNGFCRFAAAALSSCLAAPASAEGPEQLYEPGPRRGAWSLEYNGQVGLIGDAARPHSIELFGGVTDGLALGIEAEGEAGNGRLRMEDLSLEALVLLTPRETKLKAALLLQAGVSADGDPLAQTRLIINAKPQGWDALGNLILRHDQAPDGGTDVGYAVAVHREIGEHFGLGIEASGALARIDGFPDGYESGHFVGPSAAFEFDIGGEKEVELGVKYLRRIDDGDEYRDTLRLNASLRF